MIYLVLAILSSSAISICIKISDKFIKSSTALLLMNYLMCICLSIVYSKPFSGSAPAYGNGFALALGIINGFLYLGGFVLLQYNIVKNGLVMASLFSKLGVLVPTLLSVVMFAEVPSVLQVCGLIVAILSIIIINSDKSAEYAGIKSALILLLLINGGADAMSKVFETYGNAAFENHFLLFTFMSAFALCGILLAYKKEKIQLAEILFGLVIGIPNFFSSKFMLAALKTVPAVIAFPTYNISAVVLITLAGCFIFKEKLITKQKIALIGILTALCMLNI